MTRILFQTQTQEPLQDNHMVTFVLKGSSQAVVWDQGTNSIFYAVSSNAEWIRACIRVEFFNLGSNCVFRIPAKADKRAFLSSSLSPCLFSLTGGGKPSWRHHAAPAGETEKTQSSEGSGHPEEPVTVQDPWGQCNHYTLYMKQICFRPCLSSILICVPAAPFLSWTISTC